MNRILICHNDYPEEKIKEIINTKHVKRDEEFEEIFPLFLSKKKLDTKQEGK